MKKNRILCLIVACLTLGLASCNDEEPVEYSFNAQMEQPTSADSSKVYLQDERYIYWELTPSDKITIAGDQGLRDEKDKFYEARLIDANTLDGEDENNFGTFNGVFVTTMQWGSQYFLGIYPQVNETTMPINYCSPTSGSSDFGTVRIYVPTEQGLRTDDKVDITFNNNVWPMVAWYGGTWNSANTAYNLDFHAVGAIMRVQLFNATLGNFTLDSIEFISRNNATQLSGIFKVNNYKTEDPDVDAEGGYLNANTARVAIANKNGTSLGITFDASTLRSFYVVLPAYEGRHRSTTYEMTMVVHSDGRTFNKNLTVTTRRNGITYLNAIGVDGWGSEATGNIGLVGNGTAERPFKVYTANDLVYLRNCYNSMERKINNQDITPNTEIRIMRSDIVLNTTNWLGDGIHDFEGHMTYTTTGNTSASNPQGITNNSGKPLFKSIKQGGHVEGVTVKCETAMNKYGNEAFSPFCEENYGKIENCNTTSRTGATTGTLTIYTLVPAATAPTAGVCVYNYGEITGSGCTAKFNVASRNLGGICYANHGTIKGCYAAAPLNVQNATSVGGICHNNYSDGTISDCYFAAIPDSADFAWGGIVLNNQGKVEHCYTRETAAIISSATVGGIVNTNTGTIDYCWSEASLKGNGVGQIAATMSDGKIINSFCNNRLTTVTLQSTSESAGGGGLVGEMSGNAEIDNSYAYINKVQKIDNIGAIGGITGRVVGNSAKIINCYVYEYASGSTVAVGSYNTGYTGLFTNCFLVGNGQSATGLTNYTASAENFASIKTALDSYSSWGTNWVHWQQSGTNPPTLMAYTPAK